MMEEGELRFNGERLGMARAEVKKEDDPQMTQMGADNKAEPLRHEDTKGHERIKVYYTKFDGKKVYDRSIDDCLAGVRMILEEQDGWCEIKVGSYIMKEARFNEMKEFEGY